MTQIVLDEMLRMDVVLRSIQRWTTVCRVVDLRPREQIYDERIPTLLRELKQPTFVTIDEQFWDRRLCDSRYCIVYFSIRDDQQTLIPELLRSLLHLPDFNTKTKRMGKVIKVSTTEVQYYRLSDKDLHTLPLFTQRRRRRR